MSDSREWITFVVMMGMRCGAACLLAFLLYAGSCKRVPEEEAYTWKEMEVTVTAYNSVHWQTEGNPTVTAWGDTLREGMRCIAVSRDLIPLGLDHDKEVVIEGLPGTFLVKDKMHRRFKRHIDLYMGEDVAGAREWGRKRRVIRFKVPLPADSLQIPETP